MTDAALDVLLRFAEARILSRRFPDKALDLLSEAIAARHRGRPDDRRRPGRRGGDRGLVEAGVGDPDPRPVRAGTSSGWPGTGQLGPIVGREREIAALIGVLLRRTKRNPR